MNYRVGLCLPTLLFVALAYSPLVLSQNTPIPQNEPQRKASTKASEDQKREEQLRAISLIDAFIDQIRKFEDVRAKTQALAALGELLWKKNPDYSRHLFLEAYDALRAIEPDRATKPDRSASSHQKLSAEEIISLKRDIIAHVARCDAKLASQLCEAQLSPEKKDSTQSPSAEMYMAASFSLVKDNPDRAAEFAERALRSGVSEELIWFLRTLQQRDQAKADALFLTTLTSLVAQPFVDGNDLLLLGTYVFTSPMTDLGDLGASSLAVQMVPVGRQMVYNISETVPGASPMLVRLYIDAAISVLNHTVSDLTQKQLYYIAGYQLLPKAQELVPDRAPILALAMAGLRPDVPIELLNEQSYANLKRTKAIGGIEEAVDELDKLGDNERRDARALALVYMLYTKKDLNSARTLVAKIKNITARDQLTQLLDFAEAEQLIKKGEWLTAEQMASKLSASIERVVLWLSIADVRAKKGGIYDAAQATSEAIKNARRIDDSRTPWLLLMAAKEYAVFDPIMAKPTFKEAVEAFNKQKSESPLRITWSVPVEIGSTRRNFRIQVEGLEFNLNQILPQIFSIDPEETIQVLSGLQSEELRGRALTALAAVILK